MIFIVCSNSKIKRRLSTGFNVFDKKIWEPVKFIIVGIVNTAVGYTVMFVLYNAFHAGYWLSSAANYIVGSVCSFFLNKYFTFRSKRLNVKEALRFVLCIAFCYAVGYGIARPVIRMIFSPYAKRIQDNAAMILGSIVFTAMNFFGQKYIVFKKR